MDRTALIEALDYNEHFGSFIWRKSGKKAGCINRKGYLYIGFGGKLYRANRLAWFYVNGLWPAGQIDHIDGDRQNNAYLNLRDVSPFANQQNRRNGNKGSTSNFIGVSWCSNVGKWRAQISVNRKTIHCGLFETEQDAHAAYMNAKAALHLAIT